MIETAHRALNTPSKRADTDERQGALSKIIGLDLKEYFPHQATASVLVHLSNYDAVKSFISQHGHEFSEQDSIFSAQSDSSPAKETFYREMADFFEFREGKKPVGVFIGNLLDWSTYYFRYTLVRSSHRGMNFYQDFFGYYIQVLQRAGIERIEADIAPSNLRNVHILTKFGFVANGLSLSDRWGSLLRMTLFKSQEQSAFFAKQFCHGFWSPRSDSREGKGET